MCKRSAVACASEYPVVSVAMQQLVFKNMKAVTNYAPQIPFQRLTEIQSEIPAFLFSVDDKPSTPSCAFTSLSM